MREWTLHPSDPAWPPSLTELPDPPAQLSVLGTLPDFRDAVAIVGTRYADDEALELARQLAFELAATGRTIVSGGALGIDSAAHRGALDAGGHTLCVLATGFDPPYPEENAGLFQEIAQSGALLSELPNGTEPRAFGFLRRNRLIAALGVSVVVVQAPSRSGALSTARAGFKLERPVFAVPYAPWDERGAGCIELLRRGARICTSSRDVLSVPALRAGVDPDQARESGSNPQENLFDVSQLDDDARAVLRALGARAVHADNLAGALAVPIMRVQKALLQLLILGLAVERSPGRYARKPPRR